MRIQNGGNGRAAGKKLILRFREKIKKRGKEKGNQGNKLHKKNGVKGHKIASFWVIKYKNDRNAQCIVSERN